MTCRPEILLAALSLLSIVDGFVTRTGIYIQQPLSWLFPYAQAFSATQGDNMSSSSSLDLKVILRDANIHDLELLQYWDQKEHVRNISSFDDWNWQVELDRKPSWRKQWIAEVVGVDDEERMQPPIPIGCVQVIDPAIEETHYWGMDCPPYLRAIDIWIGEEDYLGKGYGTQIMTLVLDDCFAQREVEAVILDPLASNIKAQRFYERLGFRNVGLRKFGPDECVIQRLERRDWSTKMIKPQLEGDAPPDAPNTPKVSVRDATLQDLDIMLYWGQMNMYGILWSRGMGI